MRIWANWGHLKGSLMSIKELPIYERPYEKLELYGANALSNAELLAIILKTGTKEKTALMLSQEVLNIRKDADNLRFLQDLSLEDFMQIKGIGRVKAIELKAICELTKRISKPINNKIKINNSKDVADLLMPEMRYEKREMVKLLLLNNKNIVLKIKDISLRWGKFCVYRTKRYFRRSNKIECTKNYFSA